MSSLFVLALAGFALMGISPAASAAPMDRKLELVTPPGSMADIQISSTALTPDGNTVCFATEDDLVDSRTNGNKMTIDGFCARRQSSGWETRWETGPTPEEITGTSGGEVWALSPDGKRVLFTSDMNIFPDWFRTSGTGKGGNDSSYMREGDSLRWLSPAPEDPALWKVESHGSGMTGASGVARGPLAFSEDLAYGVFESSLRLLPEDTNDVVDTYMWTPTGFELVSHAPDGIAMGGRPAVKSAMQMFGAPGTISRDGSRVFFERLNGYGGARSEVPANVYSVYKREGGVVTPLPLRKGGDTAANVRFEAGSPDGDVIFLSSVERLSGTPKETGPALYRYNVDDDDVALIVTVDGGVEFLGSSEDGSTVVYRTLSDPSELKVLRAGTTTTLGTLDSSDMNEINGWAGAPRPDKRALRISSEGNVVAFAAAGTFTDPNPNKLVQVYRWAAGEGLLKISAPPGGRPATRHGSLGNHGSLGPITDGSRYKLFSPIRQGSSLGAAMSEDGSRIFFETSERLVDGDVNDAIDVYEWHDGGVRLISPGTQAHHALYHDSSADGTSVFFTTRSALIPELDRNSVRDLYVMRAGGGFRLPERAIPCVGDVCQGALPPAGPSPFSPATAGVSGSGNVSPEKARPVSLRVVASRALRGALVPVHVRVSAPGRIMVSGRAVLPASRRAAKGGSYRLGVRLKPAATHALRRRGSVVVAVRVRFRPRQGRAITRQVRVRLRADGGRASSAAGGIQSVISGKEAR